MDWILSSNSPRHNELINKYADRWQEMSAVRRVLRIFFSSVRQRTVLGFFFILEFSEGLYSIGNKSNVMRLELNHLQDLAFFFNV